MRLSRSRRILLAAAAVGATAVAAPAAAPAAAVFAPCASHKSFECATVRVPLDRSGRVGGTVPLHVERQRGTGGRSVAWIGLAGGPGQAATPLAQGTWLRLGSPVATTDQIVTFDQRGTGRSGPLDCDRAFKRATSASEATRLCGTQLGARRPFYTTTDSVEDIEAIRTELGAEKVVLVGVSYGTYVALRYARAHPATTAALVLDSVVPLAGDDAFNRSTYAAIPGVLRRLCADGACPFTSDPVADVATVAARLDRRLRGATYVSSTGRRSTKRIANASLLYGLLLDGDLNPQLRAYLPGAIAAARNGDWAPLVRLTALDYGNGVTALPRGDGRASERAEQDSDALYLATSCTDTPLPWTPASSPGPGRGTALQATTRALDPATFAPFTTTTALRTSTANRCFTWPATAAAPYVDDGAPLPAPTLILSGGADLRTPTSDAVGTQAIIPGATVVTVAGVGHYVLGNDPSGCAVAAYARFLTGQAIGDPCATVDAAATTLPRPPLRLRDVPPLGATGTTGLIARIAARTMVDGLASVRLPPDAGARVRIGGLRGGRISATFSRATERVTLSRVEYLKGYAVSGTITSSATSLRATLRIDGGRRSRSGTVRIVDATLTGTIGGNRVNAVNGRRSAGVAGAGRRDPDLDPARLRFGDPGVDIG